MKISLAVFVCMMMACGAAWNSSLRRQCRPWVDTFFSEPLKTQIAKFKSYSLDNQYQIYICGNQIVHPPTIYLSEPFAEGGRATAVVLKEHLMQGSNDATVRDITMVFREMVKNGTYDVSNDIILMQMLASKIEQMKDHDWKRITREMFLEIETVKGAAHQQPRIKGTEEN